MLLLSSSFAFANNNDALSDMFEKYGEQMFVMEAEQEVDRMVVVFDIDCGFCKRMLVEEFSTLVSNGVTIAVYPYVRAGAQSLTANQTVEAWKWSNPLAKVYFPKENIPNSKIKQFDKAQLVSMTNYIEGQYYIKGTPTTFLANGKVVEGLFTATSYLSYLHNR